MKRTKERTEKIEEEEVRSRMFDGEVSGAMREGAATPGSQWQWSLATSTLRILNLADSLLKVRNIQ